MKSLKLNKLKLNQLSKEQLRSVRGGVAPTCTCGCCYANSGGANTGDIMVREFFNIKNNAMKYLLIRNYILLSLFLLFFFELSGQNQMGNLIFQNDFKIIDSARYEILYEVEIVEDTLKPNDKIVDLQVLQIGTTYSKYFSKLLYDNDSINTILEEQHAMNLFSPPQSASMYEIVRDKKAKTFEVTDRSNDIVFRYFEDTPKLNWVIQSEKKLIRQYSCQKATTVFRGRKYEAWFTFEIPIREGPYKFGGLPGLILEMQDSQSHFVYTCIGIKKTKDPIKIRNWKYTETTRTELNKFFARIHRNTASYYKSRGATPMIKKDGKFIEAPEDFSFPYNPIERE